MLEKGNIFLEKMMTARDKIAKKNTMIENLLDDLMQSYSSTHYKLVNLK